MGLTDWQSVVHKERDAHFQIWNGIPFDLSRNRFRVE